MNMKYVKLLVALVLVVLAIGCDSGTLEKMRTETPSQMLEQHYKVILPSGEIVTMSESEYSAYLQLKTKERNAALDKLNGEIAKDVQDAKEALKKFNADYEKARGEFTK
jgi:hypothetical protein